MMSGRFFSLSTTVSMLLHCRAPPADPMAVSPVFSDRSIPHMELPSLSGVKRKAEDYPSFNTTAAPQLVDEPTLPAPVAAPRGDSTDPLSSDSEAEATGKKVRWRTEPTGL